MNANDPAFPISLESSKYHTETGVVHFGCGLTKREYFAAMAMQGLLSNPEYTQGLKDGFKNKTLTDMNLMCVRESIDMADELLKQLEK